MPHSAKTKSHHKQVGARRNFPTTTYSILSSARPSCSSGTARSRPADLHAIARDGWRTRRTTLSRPADPALA